MGIATGSFCTARAAGQDSFEQRSLLEGSEAGDTGNFGSASREDGEPELPTGSAGRSLWWTWVAPSAGDVQINLLGFTPGSFEELDTVLGVFTGESLTTLTLVAFNDDEPIGMSSRVRFQTTPGTAYHILADLNSSESGTGTAFLSLTFEDASGERPDNDRWDHATVLAGAEASDDSTFHLASREVDEPILPYPTRGRTLWWQWTPPQQGLAVVTLDGIDPDSDPVVGVYTGSTKADLRLVVANDDGGSDQESVAAFLTIPGVLYSLQADLYDNGGTEAGPVRISVSLVELPPVELRPPNDAFANAAPLPGLSGQSEADTRYATGEPGEPSGHGGIRSQSVWWKWTAPRNGVLRIKTHRSTTAEGAPLDTVLAVYRGTSLGKLEELEWSDDEGSLLTSQVEVFVSAGQVYDVAVAPALGSPTGTVRLDYEMIDGIPSPAWAARGLDNAIVTSSEFAGTVQLVNLWATWCGPCREEIPDLISLYEDHRAQGFVVVGVSVDDAVQGDWPTDLVSSFVNDYGITYPIVLDRPSGTVESGFGRAAAIPTTYVVNRQGIVVQKLVGTRSRSSFEQLILPLLTTAPPMPVLGAVLKAGGQVELSWAAQEDLLLESGASPAGPWNRVTARPSAQGDQQTLTIPTEPRLNFYRLSRP
ncbi:MAG: TlpA disulfide reductase family protein [Verrucomicrobiota bacterium]